MDMRKQAIKAAAVAAVVMAYVPFVKVCAASGVFAGKTADAATAESYMNTATLEWYGRRTIATAAEYPEGFCGSFTVILPEFEREGYEFVEWNQEKNGSGEGFPAGEEYVISSDGTLFAVWRKEQEVTAASGGSGSGADAYEDLITAADAAEKDTAATATDYAGTIVKEGTAYGLSGESEDEDVSGGGTGEALEQGEAYTDTYCEETEETGTQPDEEEVVACVTATATDY